MKAIIADDESLLREELLRLLTELWPELEIVGVYENGTDALDGIQSLNPDIAFLDIQMPGMDGLEVASHSPSATHIVFITSYDQYAVEAFETSALDYLLKPVKEDRLLKTIERLQDRNRTDKTEEVKYLVEQIRNSINNNDKEALNWIKALKGDTVHMIHINDIMFFNASEKYTIAYTVDDEFVIRTPLNKLEEMLDNSLFWRIHRSSIVNANYVKSAKRTRDGRCIVKLSHTDKTLDVSRAYAHLFKQL